MKEPRRLLVVAGVIAVALAACSVPGFAKDLTYAVGPGDVAIRVATAPGEVLADAAIAEEPDVGTKVNAPASGEEGPPGAGASSGVPNGATAAATGAGATSEASASQGAEVPGTYAELKELYLKALERIVELETALQEALDLARGYRSDWEEERAIAEAQKTEAEHALEAAKTLQDLVNEMKDIINKQHDIIMKLTEVKPVSVGFTAGVSIQRAALAPDKVSYGPGFTIGIVVFP
ncbi:MAG: hypothetical protein ACM3X3_08950 [Betaproteobacteria bacterium]